ncbi:MAG: GTPase ObgE [Myxococcales bacterium]|nr:GTPase ObgE [Myxococcales bacterium]MCB9664388.1 GTPase ObgE [Alphaproteobacteria bacterium]
MEFVDEAVVFLRSGKGGAGQISFRREKYVPKGGPDGGDGGRGGAVILEATPRRNTLVDYRYRRFQHAEDGRPGGKRQMNGAQGSDLRVPVPVGTLVYDDETEELIADLDTPGAQWSLPGGRGGLGNRHYRTSTNQAPRKAQPGEPGLERTVRLELKLIADVGLLGYPNAGKSTFLGRVSAASPKVADYPFTTLVPQLGVVRLSDESTFVLADIPGLIDGAAEGAGLGHQFLKHVERCRLLIHLVAFDPLEERTPVERWEALTEELHAFGGPVVDRPQVIALNKVDTATPAQIAAEVEALRAASGAEVHPISAVTGQGVPELVAAVWERVRPEDPEDDGG